MRFIPILPFIFFGLAIIACKKDKTYKVGNITVAINSISPDTGSYGTLVTVTGQNFSQVDSVKINGVYCNIQHISNDTLLITVPKAAGTGPVTIAYDGTIITGPNFNFSFTNTVITIPGSVNIGSEDEALLIDMALDNEGNIFTTEYSDSPKIRKLDKSGALSIFSGSGIIGYLDGPANISEFGRNMGGILIDSNGNIYMSDYDHNVFRKISPSGAVSTFAGTGLAGETNGPELQASFTKPVGFLLDHQGNIYLTDTSTLIRKITPDGIVSTFAGNGARQIVDGKGTEASFLNLGPIAMDSKGNLFIADSYTIRKITPDGTVSTFAGDKTQVVNLTPLDGIGIQAKFNAISGLEFDADDNLYLAEYVAATIRKITPDGTVTTIGGANLTFGNKNGPLKDALFYTPAVTGIDKEGNIYVLETFNHDIRKIIIQ